MLKQHIIKMLEIIKGIESLEQNQIFKPLCLEHDVVHLWYFKLRLFDLTEFIVWNI